MRKCYSRMVVCFFALWGSVVFSQDLPFQNPIDEDLKKINHKLLQLFKKRNCDENQKEINFFHVVYMLYDGRFLKSDFENDRFLMKMHPAYLPRKSFTFKRKFITTEGFLVDEKGKLLALAENGWVFCLKDYKENAYDSSERLSRFLWVEEPKLVFWINSTPMNMRFFIDKSNQIKVVVEEDGNLCTYSKEDFLKIYWNQFSDFQNSFFDKNINCGLIETM